MDAQNKDLVTMFWKFVDGGGGGCTVLHILEAKELADLLNEEYRGFAVHWFEKGIK